MREGIGVCASVITALVFAATAVPQGRIGDLRSRFDMETNPIRKARLMPDLGDAEFREIARDVEAQRIADALAMLQRYRDQARVCTKGLDGFRIDAENHPNGFKQLQISLAESIRRLDALLVSMTGDEQAPFRDVRKDLSDMNNHLIEELFPRPPEKKSKSAAPVP